MGTQTVSENERVLQREKRRPTLVAILLVWGNRRPESEKNDLTLLHIPCDKFLATPLSIYSTDVFRAPSRGAVSRLRLVAGNRWREPALCHSRRCGSATLRPFSRAPARAYTTPTRNQSSRVDMHTMPAGQWGHFITCELDLWPFEHRVSACRSPAIEYIGYVYQVRCWS